MSRWFRHYAGMMRDEKLVRITIKARQPIERVLWIWGAILESAAEIDDDGRYDIDTAEIAYFLRTEEEKILAIHGAMEEANHVGNSRVINWGDRQFKSDRSNERVAKFREAQKTAKNGGKATTAACNVTVTGDVTPGNAPETETETDIPEANASGRTSPPGPSASELTKSIFDTGVLILKAPDRNDRAARSIIGRWRKTYSDSIVLCALSRCQTEQPSDPVEWMARALQFEAQRAAGQAPQQPQRPARASVREIGMRLAGENQRIAIGAS